LSKEAEDQALYSSEQQLQGALLTARFISQALISAMSEILDACKAHVETIVLLKGISICEQHYPHTYLRPMRDLDFLVLEKDLIKTEDILRQLGYIQKSEYPSSYYAEMHHSMPFYHPERGVWVEVHTALFPKKSGIQDSAAFSHYNVMDNLVESRFNGREVYRLSDELQLLYIASHWGVEFKIHGGSIALFDTIFLLRNHHDLDWRRILSWLSDERLVLFLYTELSYLKRNNILAIPDEFYTELETHKPVGVSVNIKILHLIIEHYLVAGRPTSSILTSSNISIIWQTLLNTGQPFVNLISAPGNILFPPGHPKRFNLRFQYQRLRNSFRLPDDK
jgi:hypothetical protein